MSDASILRNVEYLNHELDRVEAENETLQSLLATARQNEQTQRQRADAAEKERDRFQRENGQVRRAKAHDRDVKRDPGIRRDVAGLGGDPSL